MKETSPKSIIKKGAQATTLLVFAFTSACGGSTPNVNVTIQECGDQAGLDIQPGSIYEVNAKRGGITNIGVDPSGKKLTIDGVSMGTKPNTYEYANSGNLLNNHLEKPIQGDVDNDGGIDMNVKSVCPPASITPTQ